MLKSHLLTMDGSPCPTAVEHMKGLLAKREADRAQTSGGILGACTTLARIFKYANSFFFY